MMWGKNSQFREYKDYILEVTYSNGSFAEYLLCGKHVIAAIVDIVRAERGVTDFDIAEPQDPKCKFNGTYGSCAICAQRKQSN